MNIEELRRMLPPEDRAYLRFTERPGITWPNKWGWLCILAPWALLLLWWLW
jgi:hypothetical protein